MKGQALDNLLDALVWMRRKAKKRKPVDDLIDELINIRRKAKRLAFGPSRALAGRLLPAPGQGPGERARRAGRFRIDIHARTSAGVRYVSTGAARGDPGYAATSVMLGESALCLALDRDRLPGVVGVLTPATAMGGALADRLRSAGQTLAVRRITG